MEVKSLNLVAKLNISIQAPIGILGETTNLHVRPLNNTDSVYVNEDVYKNGYDNITITYISGIYFNLTIFGYKNKEDAKKANIKVTYTPAYGGSVNYFLNRKFEFSEEEASGYGESPFLRNLYGVLEANSYNGILYSKQNNGIYKFEDLNNKYIKPTYLHLKLP
ncbi:hypothetical protein L8X35_07710 [Campylobacter lari]|nr:hypothetical protein [Campylobacter lari]